MALPVIPNNMLARSAELAQLLGTNDAVIAVLIQSSGLEASGTLQDYDTVAQIFTVNNLVPTFSGYARITATGVVATPSDVSNNMSVDCADFVWNPTSAQAIGAIIIAYDYDTTSGTDTTLYPLFIDACSGTTGTGGAGTPFTYQVASGGFITAVQA
jgi:hypothetical protein